MNRLYIPVVLLVASATTLVAVEACAQGRGPSVKDIRGRAPMDEAAARTAKLAELKQWLRRLQGKFRVRISSIPGKAFGCLLATGPQGRCLEEMVLDDPSPARYEGSGECKSIGEGSGSSCQFDILPDARDVPGVPLVILYGLDPDLPGIRLTWVGGGTAAWEASGSLVGNTIDIVCISRSCSDVAFMSSSRDGQRIETTFVHGARVSYRTDTSTIMELRRFPTDAKEATAQVPSTPTDQ